MKSRVEELTLDIFPDSFDVPSVILLSKDSCHLCRKLKPIYNKISKIDKYEIYNFYMIDTEDQPLVSVHFKTDGVPTIYVVYEDEGVEIPYPKDPPESGYGEEDITNFLDELMEE